MKNSDIQDMKTFHVANTIHINLLRDSDQNRRG